MHINFDNIGKIAYFRNLLKENSSKIFAHWIYQSINVVLNSLLTNQIAHLV